MLTHVTDNHEQQWDAFALRHGGGFLQSWGWSKFQEAVGRKVFRFKLTEASADKEGMPEGDVRAQFVLVELPLPIGQKYSYVPRGPVVKISEDAAETRANIVSAVQALRQKIAHDGATFARVEWPWPVTANVLNAKEATELGFTQAGHMQPQHTVIADLAKTEEQLLVAMHQKTRYNIRVAEKHGVVIREASRVDSHRFEHDIDVFWGMLDETASRDKFSTHDRAYYRDMLKTLSSENGGMHTRLIFAEYEGRAVAAAIVGEFGTTMTYLHGASVAADRKVMAPYLLHWSIMQLGKSLGYLRYDFWGVAPVDASEDHPWSGITRFKTGFGGERVDYLGAWELPGNGFWYRVYRVAKRLRRA